MRPCLKIKGREGSRKGMEGWREERKKRRKREVKWEERRKDFFTKDLQALEFLKVTSNKYILTIFCMSRAFTFCLKLKHYVRYHLKKLAIPQRHKKHSEENSTSRVL